MPRDLEGRVALITAAGSGMGRQASIRFAAEGAHVVVADINGEAAETAATEARAAGGGATAIPVDMTDLSQVSGLVDRVASELGRLDVLYNHVGAPGPRGFDFDEAAWRRSVDLNLTAPIFLTKAALPLIRQGGRGGSVIFTSSISGLIASRNSPVYSAVKSGVVGFMRCIAAIGAADAIRSNAICPGTVETPMLTDFFQAPGESEEVLQQRLASFKQSIPLGRYCKPEEVAELALFLASDRSSYLTGVAIPLDGGYVAI